MKKLSKEEIQIRELEILIQISDFCKKNKLRYYLCGGTLLGAIRHQGFIPWDDDIDICMPRPDYELFVRSFQNESLKVISDSLKNWDAPCAKVIDLNTKLTTKNIDSVSHLWVDIFPIDGFPNTIEGTKKIYKKCNFYRWLYGIGHANMNVFNFGFHKLSKMIFQFLIRFYGINKISKKIELIAQKYPYEKSEYVGCVTWGLYGVGERMKKEEFEKLVQVQFEGGEFPTYSCWNSYLEGIYGDYMKLPPVEQRQTHEMTVYLKT